MSNLYFVEHRLTALLFYRGMMENTTTALVPLQPKFSYEEAKSFAIVAVKSGMFLQSLGLAEPNKALAILMMGREMGLGMGAALRNIWIGDNGVPQLYSRAMAALIKQSGDYDYKTLQWTDKIAEIQFLHRRGNTWEELTPTSVFTDAEAKQAGLLDKKGNVWKSYRKNMLWSRALSNGFGIHCPHLANGMPIYAVAEEEHPNYGKPGFRVEPLDAPKYAETSPPAPMAVIPPEAEWMPTERPGAIQVTDDEYARFLSLAQERGSSLEAIKQHHHLEDLRLMSKEVYHSILKVLEAK